MPLTTLNATRQVLRGSRAEASVGGVVIALLTEWEVEVETDTVDVTAHGDYWKFNAPVASSWTFRAKQWVVPASANHTINSLYSSSNIPSQVTVAGYSGAAASQGGSLASNVKIFEGTGTPKHANLNAPMGLAEQGFEVMGNGSPATGV